LQECCGVEGAEAGRQVDGAPVVTRWVAQLAFTEIKKFEPFDAAGLRVTPLPVMHGEDLVSLGFSFGEREQVPRPTPLSVLHEERMRSGTAGGLTLALPSRGEVWAGGACRVHTPSRVPPAAQ
jgi:hypothetical protein